MGDLLQVAAILVVALCDVKERQGISRLIQGLRQHVQACRIEPGHWTVPFDAVTAYRFRVKHALERPALHVKQVYV